MKLSEDSSEIIQLLLKMVLQLNQRLRRVESTVLTTMRGPGGTAVIKAMEAEVKEYMTAVKEIRNQEGDLAGMGPPGPTIFLRWVKALSKADVGAANKTQLTEFYTRLKGCSQEEIFHICPVIRHSIVTNSEEVLVSFNITDADACKLITDAMRQLGYKRLIGAAPAGHMEREAADWLRTIVDAE